jgi:hypothetical protein
MAVELGAQLEFASDQKRVHAVVPCRLNRTFDFRFRRPVGAHRVQGYDAWHGEFGLACLFDVQNFAALVVAALGTGAVRHLALVAVGALGKRVAFQCIMGATSACARFGVSPFRIWHDSSGLPSNFELSRFRTLKP